MKVCRGAGAYPPSSRWVSSISRLNFSRYTHLAENTVKLTEACVKFNYRPAVDALCVTQGDRRKRQPGGDPVGSSEHKSQWPGPLPRAGILPSRSPPTLQEQLMVTHHRRSPRVSLSLSALRSVERECNTHCWPLRSIIHVLLLK